MRKAVPKWVKPFLFSSLTSVAKKLGSVRVCSSQICRVTFEGALFSGGPTWCVASVIRSRRRWKGKDLGDPDPVKGEWLLGV